MRGEGESGTEAGGRGWKYKRGPSSGWGGEKNIGRWLRAVAGKKKVEK